MHYIPVSLMIFLSIINQIDQMYLHKLHNKYPSKTSSDLFNIGFKYDIV